MPLRRVHTVLVEEDELLAAARQIHDEADVGEPRVRLGALLDAADSAEPNEGRQRVLDEINELLCSDERTRRRLDELLPELTAQARTDPTGAGELEGDPELIFDRWSCPSGDYAWPILDVADEQQPPDRCPNHGLQLVFRSAGD